MACLLPRPAASAASKSSATRCSARCARRWEKRRAKAVAPDFYKKSPAGPLRNWLVSPAALRDRNTAKLPCQSQLETAPITKTCNLVLSEILIPTSTVTLRSSSTRLAQARAPSLWPAALSAGGPAKRARGITKVFNSNGLQHDSDGLQPTSNGPQPHSDGLQPHSNMASNLIATASNLIAMASNVIAMASNLIAMASNRIAMVSNLIAIASNLQ